MYENHLKWCREELEMTQEELGYIFGVSDAAVRSWENAYYSIPLTKLIKFCNLYDYSLDYVSGLTRINKKYGKFKTNKEIIGKNLKYLRAKLNLSQQELSDKCKIAQTTYSGYETGHYLINTITLYYISKTFNVSMDWIVGRTNNKRISK